MRITTAASALFSLGLCLGLPACVVDTDEEVGTSDPDDPGTEAAFGIRCPGCTYNGFGKRPSDYVPGQLNRSALRNAGLYGSTGPISLCTSTANNQCTCRAGWASWINNDSTSTHVQQFTYLAKVIAPHGFTVHCGAYSYGGDAGLATNALTGEWSYRDQEVISAGLVAMLNTIGGVEACFTTPDRPGGCAGAGMQFEESVSFGTVFLGGADRHIAGGRKLNGLHYNPERLKRPCTGNVDESCASHIEHRYASADGGNPGSHGLAYCEFASREGYRYATRCRDAGGTWWNNPLTVRLNVAPENNGYYFSEPNFERAGCNAACAREY